MSKEFLKMEIAARDVFLDIKQGKIDALEDRVKELKLNQNILLCDRDDLFHVVNVCKSKNSELFSVIRSKDEKISFVEERNKFLENQVEEKDKKIDYLEKFLIPSIWEKVAEGNDLNAKKKEMFFAKCEKNKALKTEIGCLNEKMRKMKKELQWKDYQFEQLNHDIDEIIFEKMPSYIDKCSKKIQDQTKYFGDLTGNLCDWIKNATVNEIEEVKKHTQSLSKENTRKFILFQKDKFLQRLALNKTHGGHAHMDKTKEASDESHAQKGDHALERKVGSHAQILHRLAPTQGGHAHMGKTKEARNESNAQKGDHTHQHKVGSHAQRGASSLEGALSHVGAPSRGAAPTQGGHALKGKYESHAQRDHAHKGKSESHAQRGHAYSDENQAQKGAPAERGALAQMSHAQIGALAGSRLLVWLEGRTSAQVSHAQIGASVQGGHAHKDKDEEALDTVAMFTVPVEAVDCYWSTDKEFLEKILEGNFLDSFYKIK